MKAGNGFSLLSPAGGALNATGWSAQFAGSLTGLTPAASHSRFVGTWSASAAGNTTTLQQMVLLGLN